MFIFLLITIFLTSVFSSSSAPQQSNALIEYAADPDIRSYSSIASCLITYILLLASVFSCHNSTAAAGDSIGFFSLDSARSAALTFIGADSVGMALWRQAHKSDARLWKLRTIGLTLVMRIVEFILVLLIDTAQPCLFAEGYIYLGILLSLFITGSANLFLEPPPHWYDDDIDSLSSSSDDTASNSN